ncbi:MAG: choice-of-anchor tandem repeat GloVer-containing protein, partial [Thermoanaerobaculia bacterium]
YGTTSQGGSGEGSDGTVFRISTTGDFTELYHFDYSNSSDPYPEGGDPQAPPVQTPQGDLYGTTALGGSFDRGVVYEITHDGAFQKVYEFTGGTDGSEPLAALVLASDGNLYGTTSMGSTIFRVTPGSIGLTTVHGIDYSTEGSAPEAPLVEGSDGALYGTTYDAGPGGGGTVFRMELNGQFTVLHSFHGTFYTGPKNTGLTLMPDGYFYGVRPRGGLAHQGSIYRVSPTGSYGEVHDFTGVGGSGAQPISTLASGPGNKLYGTTIEGGKYGDGTVFRYVPPPAQ